MARIRSVHPSICQSADMAQLPAHLERTYVRLWTHCDDEGRAVDNPRLVKAAIYPLHDEQTWETVDGELAELEQRGFIARYESGDVRYLSVLAWGKYQRPQKKVESKLPPLPEGYAPPPVVVPETSANGKPLELGIRNLELGVSQRRAPREPANNSDGLWTALEELFGPVTESHRTRRGKIVKGLRALKAAPEDVAKRAAVWPDLFPGSKLTLTDTALEKFWGNLGLLVEAEKTPLADCDVCRNRRQVGITAEGFSVVWDDEWAVSWKPCRCVKGAKS